MGEGGVRMGEDGWWGPPCVFVVVLHKQFGSLCALLLMFRVPLFVCLLACCSCTVIQVLARVSTDTAGRASAVCRGHVARVFGLVVC